MKQPTTQPGERILILLFGSVIVIAVLVFLYRFYLGSSKVTTPSVLNPKKGNLPENNGGYVDTTTPKNQTNFQSTNTTPKTNPTTQTNNTNTTPKTETTTIQNNSLNQTEIAIFLKNELAYHWYDKCGNTAKICDYLKQIVAQPNAFKSILGGEYKKRADNTLSHDLEYWIGRKCTCRTTRGSDSFIVDPKLVEAFIFYLKQNKL